MTFRVADAEQPRDEYQGDWDWTNRWQQSEGTVLPTVLHSRKQCVQCNRMFNNMEEIRRHVAEAHSFVPRPFPCGYRHCNRSFLTQGELGLHRREHEPEDRPHECPVCAKRFRHASNLNQHIKYHVPGRRHFCAVCGKCFRTLEQLNSHHTRCLSVNESPEGALIGSDGREIRFECDYCGKPFHFRRDKLIHERIHTGVKPYTCGYCGKGFTQSQACQIHIRTHTGEKPYSCKQCPKRFMDNSALRKHEANHYTSDIPLRQLRVVKRQEGERKESYEEEERGGRGYRDESRLHLMSQREESYEDGMGEEELEEEVEEEIIEEEPIEDEFYDSAYGNMR